MTFTWTYVAVGGGVCGVLSVNYSSLLFCFLTAPVGFVLAAVIGTPVVLVLAVWLTFQRPGPDPRFFAFTLKIIGASIALAINGTTNIWFLRGGLETSATSTGGPVLFALVVALGIACIIASGCVGWICGASLAQRHLEAIGHPEERNRRLARYQHPWR